MIIPVLYRFAYGLASFLLALSLATVAHAQLNENCTVSILNRTAQVKPDGTWIATNVPANFGQVRARATCVENGITRSGQSDLFTIPANGSVTLSEIKLNAVTPIPQSLALSAPTTTLTTTGATTQITVTARFSDGSTKNVSAGSTGTSYTNSNSRVATVSPNGLFTAVSSGTVIISALNEGALGLLQIRVTLSGGDADSDGIPDDIEIANGLNPNDPTDGFADPDGDGLTNKQELVDFGTNPQVADTDGDGIADGEETKPGADGFVTNPLLADTDGDGVNDGSEVAGGSDPTNPSDRGRALVSIEVSPANFTLTVNTILGEASQQLKVTGRLKNGGIVDLTSTTQGTNYTSSDLNRCNFGAEPGRVFAGGNGTCTITATNGGFSAQSVVTVQTFTPTALAAINIPNGTNNVDVDGDFAYVAAGVAGLQVVDVSNRSAPQIVSTFDTPGLATDVKVLGKTAFVADGASGLQIVDVTDPRNPTLRGAFSALDFAQDVVVKGTRAFIADGASGLRIIDVSNPATPVLISSIATLGMAQGVDVSQDGLTAVVAEGTSGLQIVDLTDAAHPVIIGALAGGNARDVVIRDNFAFVADYNRSFTSVDISNPRIPVLRTSTPSNTGGLLDDVALAGRFAFGADIFFVNGVPIIDISTPATPVPRAILDFSRFGDDNGIGIAVDSSFIYLVTDKSRLLIGQYLALEDKAGNPPAVQITSPASGETVIEGATLPIIVEATDDVAVDAVNLLVNGVSVSTDTSAPYEFNLTVPTGISTLTLGALATDLGGNAGSAPSVELDVIPDPLTTAVGRVVDQDTNPVGNAAVTCLGGSGFTNSSGHFSISGLPTIRGAIGCTATFTTPGGKILKGTSARVVPVPGGMTNIGEFRISENIGHTKENPAKSCLEILQQGFVDGDRKYWIKVPSGVFEMHCDFSSDTGGWTRVGALNGTQNYCTTSGSTDMRVDPDAGAGKIPDADARAIMEQTPGSPHDVMYFIREDSRYVWHALQTVADFETSSKHSSSGFYCTDWHCDNGSIDTSVCGTEGDGCPVTAHGQPFTTKKIYVDSSFSAHARGFHSNGSICGLPNYTRASIWVYVR